MDMAAYRDRPPTSKDMDKRSTVHLNTLLRLAIAMASTKTNEEPGATRFAQRGCQRRTSPQRASVIGTLSDDPVTDT